MKLLKLAILTCASIFTLTTILYADSQSTQFSLTTPMYKGQTLQIQAGADIEGYSYMGLLISRKESNPPNADTPDVTTVPGSYTEDVLVAGNSTYFIPKSEATVTSGGVEMFNFRYDVAGVQEALFSVRSELDAKGIVSTINTSSRVFSLEWYHVYRQPDGKIIAVGRGFKQYDDPYRTFFKLGPQALQVDIETGSYNKETPITFEIIFSEPVTIKGKFKIKFKDYPQPIALPTSFEEYSVHSISDTILLPVDFPETNRNYSMTIDSLPSTSNKSEYIILEENDNGDKLIVSDITGMAPDGLSLSTIEGMTPTNITPLINVGYTPENSMIYDNSRPSVNLVNMVLTSRRNVTLPTHIFDSVGESTNPIYFNNMLTTMLGEYSDSGSGPAILSVLSPTYDLLKSGVIPNDVIVTPSLPPYRIGADAIVTDKNALLNLSAAQIRNSITSETLFEGEVGLTAVVKDMIAYDDDNINHQESQSFKIYIDLYPPKVESARIDKYGKKYIVVKSENSKITKVEYLLFNNEAMQKLLNNTKWDNVPDFYLYPDGFNHGADTLEAYRNFMFDDDVLLINDCTTDIKSIDLDTPEFLYEEEFTNMGNDTYKYILYRTEDELGNIGYGKIVMDTFNSGKPFLTQIDIPKVNDYFSCLPATNNSVMKIQSRTINAGLEPGETQEVKVSFSLYRESSPDIPINNINKIELGRLNLQGPNWKEFSYEVDLRNYVVDDTDLDGKLLLEIQVAAVVDESNCSVPGRVPITVHSVVPSITHTTSVPIEDPENFYPNIQIDTSVTSGIPLFGVFNNIGDTNITPSFIYSIDSANENWTQIEPIYSKLLENLNGEIYYNVLAIDLAKNRTLLKIGPLQMYSDLQSYVASSSVASFIGNNNGASTASLILTDKIDNNLKHVTRLNSRVQLPMLNLNAKIYDDTMNRLLNTGSSTSTELEIPFNVRNAYLDYRKYIADYSMTTGLKIKTPIYNKTSEVYTIVNPIQNLFDVELSKIGGTLGAKATLKSNLSGKSFTNMRSLQDVVDNSKDLFGLDLIEDLYINVNNPISHESAKKLDSTGVSIGMGDSDYIVIGYKGKDGYPDYELKFYWDSNLANVKITNVPNTLVRASKSYEIQLKSTHLGQSWMLPSNMTEEYIREFKTSIMIIPSNEPAGYVESESLSDNWDRMKTLYAKDYTIQENRTIEENGRYDILVEVITPFKITCYDYARLDLLLADNEDYLASENNPSVLVSKSTILNKLSRKIANHSINTTRASDVGAYQLSNGDILVFSKKQQMGDSILLEIYDTSYNVKKKFKTSDIGSFSKINDVEELQNIILLGTNAGLFSLNLNYDNIASCNISGAVSSSTVETYQIEKFKNRVLIGVDDANTLQLLDYVSGSDDSFTLTFQSMKTSDELFLQPDRRVHKMHVYNSDIYVTYDVDTTVVKYVVLE